jgi:hypothetical protein
MKFRDIININEGPIKYNDEYIKNTFEKYKGKSWIDFYKNENGLYNSLKVRKPELLKNFIDTLEKRKPKYTEEEIRKVTQKYDSLMDFRKNEPEVYSAAVNKGKDFYADIQSHMKKSGNLYKRAVYVYEFYDINENPVAVYVGLTQNENQRKKSHMGTDKKKSYSAVREFIIKNPHLTQKYFLVSDGYINAEDAVRLECEYESKYRNDGRWVVLNRGKCGGLGGGSVKYTEEKVKDIVSKYDNYGDFVKENPKLYSAISKSNKQLRDEIGRILQKNRITYTDEEIRKITSKYNDFSEFYENEPKLYMALSKGKKLPHYTNHMIRSKRSLFTNDDIVDLAVKSGSYENFRKEHPKEYISSKVRKITDIILNALNK